MDKKRRGRRHTGEEGLVDMRLGAGEHGRKTGEEIDNVRGIGEGVTVG